MELMNTEERMANPKTYDGLRKRETAPTIAKGLT